ncbi:hypothetical protein [Mesorhizobium sp. NZP2077]|uniref:hypothetical protein n=1 Tax=Mesorhizobium sp. NZP2077 TaxID=2483404 RepID=UPI00155423A8|nr:hypothetical protein EB232_13590 [Mesorhizobium sp. NZP2077]QKD16007.1 hypothetical protein HGP13_13395 [Mesorhizobium sp. NZP2077]
MSAKLETMLERVDVVATVHRRTCQSNDMQRFDVSAFAGDLVSDVIGISGRTDATLVAMFPANSCHPGSRIRSTRRCRFIPPTKAPIVPPVRRYVYICHLLGMNLGR